MTEERHWSSAFVRRGFTTTACGLACFATNSVFAGEPCQIYRQEVYSRSTRHSTNMAFAAQSQKARVLTYTLWNYHFHEDSSELKPSGQAQLERLARRFPYACPDVFIQSAHDFRVTEGDVDAYFMRRKELDALRTQAVSEYLQRMIQGQLIAVQIHDRPPVGMSADETRTSYTSLIQKAPSGLLPIGITDSRFEIGYGAGGGGASPFTPQGSEGSSGFSPPTFSSEVPGPGSPPPPLPPVTIPPGAQ